MKKQRYEHRLVNITNLEFTPNKCQSLPKQVLEYYEDEGWELCAIDDIYYYFKQPLNSTND